MKKSSNKTLREIKIAILFVIAFLLLMMVWSHPIMTLVAILSIGHFYSKMYPEVFFPIASFIWILAGYYSYKVFKEDEDE